MSPVAIVALAALSLFAVYRQSVRSEVVGAHRFKTAIVFAVIGLVVGGFHVPENARGWLALAGGILLGMAVGIGRARLTSLSVQDGRVYARGTAASIGLFVALIVFKFGLGTYEYLHGHSSHGGFGEVLLMIAVMVAFQAELVWRRARVLLDVRGDRGSASPAREATSIA